MILAVPLLQLFEMLGIGLDEEPAPVFINDQPAAVAFFSPFDAKFDKKLGFASDAIEYLFDDSVFAVLGYDFFVKSAQVHCGLLKCECSP